MYAIVRALSRLSLALFYRRGSFGDRRLPERGATLLVANHPNGLLDPVALMALTRRRVRFLAKAPLFAMPVLGPVLRAMGALPVWRTRDGADTARNEETFGAVFDALGRGELVGLFPEGTSHSEPGLLDLRTGAARMALGAESRAGGGLGVAVVPVGLVYGRKGRFRSRMASWVGEPVGVSDLVALARRDERAAVRELTGRISAALSAVTLPLESWDDLPLLELAEGLWPRRGGHRLERLRRFAEALRELRARDPERAERLARRVSDLKDRLDGAGMAASDLDRRYTPGGVTRFLGRNALALGLALPLFATGLALWWIPYRLVGRIARRRRVERELVATVKVLAGVVVYGAWLALLLVAAALLGGLPAALGTAVAAPATGVAAVLTGDRFRAVRADVATFLRLAGAERLQDRLRRRRDELVAEMEAVDRELAAPAPPAPPAAPAGREP